MAVSPGEGTSIIVRGDAPITRRTGRIQKPTAKVRVVQQINGHEDVAELKDKIQELSQLIQDLLQRDTEREQLLKNCSRKIETLEKELQQEKQKSALQQEGLGRSRHARSAEIASQGQSLMEEANRAPTGKPTYAQKLAAAVKTTSAPVTKPTKEPVRPTADTVVVVPQTPLPSIQSKNLRDELNSALKAPVVIGASLSGKGNIVIRLKDYTADEFLNRKAEWRHVFDKISVKDVTKPEQWLKLVAYVPVAAADGFVEDLRTFHGVNVVGTPFWLKKPEEGVYSAPLCFSVRTETEKKTCREGIWIGGVRVNVSNYRAFSKTTQCYRCQGYSHNPSLCKNRLKCRCCGGNHPTKAHRCPTCNSSALCDHLTAKCANCQGNHMANSEECEIRRALYA